MLIRGNVWMTSILMMTLTFCATGCVSGGSGNAICAGTQSARTEHAAALATDGGPVSLVTGARLIKLVDAGCNDGK